MLAVLSVSFGWEIVRGPLIVSICILERGAEDFRGGSQIFRAKKGGI